MWAAYSTLHERSTVDTWTRNSDSPVYLQVRHNRDTWAAYLGFKKDSVLASYIAWLDNGQTAELSGELGPAREDVNPLLENQPLRAELRSFRVTQSIQVTPELRAGAGLQFRMSQGTWLLFARYADKQQGWESALSVRGFQALLSGRYQVTSQVAAMGAINYDFTRGKAQSLRGIGEHDWLQLGAEVDLNTKYDVRVAAAVSTRKELLLRVKADVHEKLHVQLQATTAGKVFVGATIYQ